MSIHLSSALVIADVADGLSLDHPIIGWRNVVTASTIVADTEEASFPASNLANPATHLEWRAADTTEQYLTITTNEVDPIDYIGIARHNFFTAEIAPSIEGFIDGVWTEIVDQFMPPNDGPLICRYALQSLAQVRIKLPAGSAAARAAVVYAGKLTPLERRIWVGHTPLVHGRKSSVSTGVSESGNFLGRTVTGAWRESTIPLSLLSPDFYRSYIDPFLAVVASRPFFFAHRPQTYPREAGYCWITDDGPVPVPVGPSNLIAFDIKVRGIS
jgi:hypothetical protein